MFTSGHAQSASIAGNTSRSLTTFFQNYLKIHEGCAYSSHTQPVEVVYAHREIIQRTHIPEEIVKVDIILVKVCDVRINTCG